MGHPSLVYHTSLRYGNKHNGPAPFGRPTQGLELRPVHVSVLDSELMLMNTTIIQIQLRLLSKQKTP